MAKCNQLTLTPLSFKGLTQSHRIVHTLLSLYRVLLCGLHCRFTATVYGVVAEPTTNEISLCRLRQWKPVLFSNCKIQFKPLCVEW